MSAAAARGLEARAGRARDVLASGASLALHGALLAAVLLIHSTPLRRTAPVEVEIVETRRAPSPLPPPSPPAPPNPAASRPTRPPPRIARTVPPAPAPPAPADTAPPPPSAASTEPARPGPIRIGVSMSSTTAAGSTAVATGNTLYGRPPTRAGDPAEAAPYRSDRYAPPTSVSSLPEPIRVEVPRSEYPPDAARQGIEGVVRLRLFVDEEGNVREATLLSDPGHGLGPAAVRAAKRYFKFRPARRDGVTVATEIPFTVQFELD